MDGYLLKGLIVLLVVRHGEPLGWLLDTERRWKEKGRSEDSCGKNSILPESLSISDSYPILANARALTLSCLINLMDGWDGRDSWVAAILVIVSMYTELLILLKPSLHPAGWR